MTRAKTRRVGLDPLRAAWNRQKQAAKARGIAWLMPFEEWIDVWVSSGMLSHRGRGVDKYVMARYGDIGPYSKTNVEIILHQKNSSDARTNHPKTTAELQLANIGKGRGWTKRGNSFQVFVAKKYVGCFRSQDVAEKAYAEASKQMICRCAGVNPTQPEGGR